MHDVTLRVDFVRSKYAQEKFRVSFKMYKWVENITIISNSKIELISGSMRHFQVPKVHNLRASRGVSVSRTFID